MNIYKDISTLSAYGDTLPYQDLLDKVESIKSANGLANRDLTLLFDFDQHDKTILIALAFQQKDK